MATDRMYLVCQCGSKVCLAKTMTWVEWYTPGDAFQAQLDAWLDEHALHRGDRKRPPFALTYESDR